jgi:hypothetical protein
MGDVWPDVGYVVLMIVFVALAVLFVIGCDKIIGPDEAAMGDDDHGESDSDRQKALL